MAIVSMVARGHAINTLAVVSTVFGVATTLGLGVIQINSGLAAVAGTGFIAAFLFMVLMLWMAGALLHALRNEQRQKELHEALLRERVQRLLEEHDRRTEADTAAEAGPQAAAAEETQPH